MFRLLIHEIGRKICKVCFSNPTSSEIMHIIFIQIKGNQILIFIWQGLIDGVSKEGPILVGENTHIKKS